MILIIIAPKFFAQKYSQKKLKWAEHQKTHYHKKKKRQKKNEMKNKRILRPTTTEILLCCQDNAPYIIYNAAVERKKEKRRKATKKKKNNIISSQAFIMYVHTQLKKKNRHIRQCRHSSRQTYILKENTFPLQLYIVHRHCRLMWTS